MRAPIYDHHHAVQFYGDDEALFTTVSGFLGQGMIDGQPAIVIGTADHSRSILEHLKGRSINVEQAQVGGDLIVLDAHETLAKFMDDDGPDPARFEESVGCVIANLVNQRPGCTLVRAYGEMVDVLWKRGQPEAAVRLEMLWNKLANQHGFALLCGYSMGTFFKETKLFEDVCRAHTHVLPAVPDELLRKRPRISVQ
jgi:hypothetical protein